MRYTVRPGDTLSKIAAAHGTTLEALLGANPRYRQRNGFRSAMRSSSRATIRRGWLEAAARRSRRQR